MSRTLASAIEEHRGLGLLLVLSSTGCLGLPRFDGPIDDDAQSETDTGDETSPVTTAGPGPQPTTAGPGPQPTTAGPGPQPTTSTTGPSTSTTGPMPTVTTTPPPPPVLDVNQGLTGCQSYAEIMDYCYGEPSGEQAYEFCSEYVMELEQNLPECVPLLDGFFVCISGLPCGDIFGEDTLCSPLLDAFLQCTS